MSCRKHVVITGTGRAGTTFLVELLTQLGFDTGYRIDELPACKSSLARAGLEHDIRRDDCPHIVKSPYFCDYADEVLARQDLLVEHVFIPVRDLFAAAESRRWVQHTTFSALPFVRRLRQRLRPKTLAGGLWQVRPGAPDDQERVLLEKVYRLLLGVSGHMVPTTFMQYPLMTEQCGYLFGKLGPILAGIPFAKFRTAYEKTVQPDLVHDFGRLRTV